MAIRCWRPNTLTDVELFGAGVLLRQVRGHRRAPTGAATALQCSLTDPFRRGIIFTELNVQELRHGSV